MLQKLIKTKVKKLGKTRVSALFIRDTFPMDSMGYARYDLIAKWIDFKIGIWKAVGGLE